MKVRSLVVLYGLTALVALTGCWAVPKDASSPARPVASEQTALVNKGLTQLNEGKTDQARASFVEAAAKDAKDKYAWYNLGYLAQMAGNDDEAIGRYDKAIAADPSYTSALYNRAILLEAKDAQRAVSDYRKILSINPNASTTYIRLGGMLAKEGDQAGAKEAYAKGISLDPALTNAVPAEYRDADAGPGR